MESSSLIHYKLLKADLDRLLENIKNSDLDIYSQRTILRDGIKNISKKCEKTIELLNK